MLRLAAQYFVQLLSKNENLDFLKRRLREKGRVKVKVNTALVINSGYGKCTLVKFAVDLIVHFLSQKQIFNHRVVFYCIHICKNVKVIWF